MRLFRHTRWMAVAALAASPAAAQTQAAITPADLRARLYTFAHDSMMGREAGTAGHDKATAYLARELTRLGLRPAGENGSFFQTVPLVRRALDPRSSISVGATALNVWTDYAVYDQGAPTRSINGAQVIFGGVVGDTANWISREQAAGKVVVIAARPGQPLNVGGGRFRDAVGLVITGIDPMLSAYMSYLRKPSVNLAPKDTARVPVVLMATTQAAGRLLGAPVMGMRPGTTGGMVRGTVGHTQTAAPSRNVVAVLPGSDPALRGQYVAIGAHSDHDGITDRPVDHDSLRAFNAVMRPEGANVQGDPTPSAEQAARIRTALDSLRRTRPARRDSIMNGADDDASGSVGVLEIAESYAKGTQRPKRSVLFVWHTAEEKGLVGARYFTDNPTVLRDSIVAGINIDMIGRGEATDVAKGGPGYVQLLGSRRLSTELGNLVEAANRARRQPFTFDYSYDAEGHPEQYYCRSDHAMYARYGIPIVFFTTGSHRDYHMVTDEPQYINYPKLTEVTQFIADVGLRVANLDHRLVVDKPKPDPNAPCRQ